MANKIKYLKVVGVLQNIQNRTRDLRKLLEIKYDEEVKTELEILTKKEITLQKELLVIQGLIDSEGKVMM